jgi:hypothetical protein
MIRQWIALFIVALMVCLEIACASPKIEYQSDVKNPSSPPDGGFAFALRTSTVLLSTNSAKKTDPPPTAGAKDATPVAAAPLAPSTISCKQSNDKNLPGWEECVRAIQSSVTPISSSTVYVAKPSQSFLSKTVVTVQASSADPLLISSMTVNATSTVPNAVTAAGSGAATGFVWGPWGAAAGALLGGFGSLIRGNSTGEPVTINWWELVCKDKSVNPGVYKDYTESQHDELNAKKFGISLSLPVTLDFELSHEVNLPETKPLITEWCWMPLPAGGDSSATESNPDPSPTGWFYRFVPDQDPSGPKHVTLVPPMVLNKGLAKPSLPDGVVEKNSFFSSADENKFLPVSACRAADLEITWWSELEKHAMKAGSVAITDQIGYHAFKLVVADPTYIQKVRLPTHGTITLAAICGGYAGVGTPSTDINDAITNALKQVQPIMDAQSKWVKAKAGK